jgi:hypothetical protein
VEVSEDDDSIRELRVHVGDNNVRLNNVREINEGPPA